MISLTSSGSTKNTKKFLEAMKKLDIRGVLQGFGREGVQALSLATPVRSGVTASSWGYEVSRKGDLWEIMWTNSATENGFPIAIMLQYGHGTGTGGYVQGQDYINPAIQSIFDRIADEVWKVVTSS